VNGPGVIKRLNGEERNLNEGVNVLSEQAFVFLSFVCFIALGGWRKYLLIWKFHEILKLQLINVSLCIEVGLVKEDAGIGQRPHFGSFWDSLSDVICPKKSCESSSRLTCNYNLSRVGPEAIVLVDGLELSLSDVVTSEIQIAAFIANWTFTIALMSCAVTVFQIEDTKVS
jgi:hypothetical protein